MSDFVAFLVIIPLIAIPLILGVQVFLYYDAVAATSSAAYFSLRQAEVGFQADPTGAESQAAASELYAYNLEGLGLDPADGSVVLEPLGSNTQYFRMRARYDLPVRLWGRFSEADGVFGETLPIHITLLGRRSLR